jgi:hypothetical protein
LATTALGSFIVIPLLYLVNANPNDKWVPTNLDDGHLDYYFFLLAGLMCISIALLYYLAKDYEYKTAQELKLLEDDTVDEQHHGIEENSIHTQHNPLIASANGDDGFVTAAVGSEHEYKADDIRD